MRVAIVADIHDNFTALAAVVRDLRHTAPDVVLHAGDIVGGGARPVATLDYVRELGWRGVHGNTDEAIYDSGALERIASQSAAPATLWQAVRDQLEFARTTLGDARNEWLRALPRELIAAPLAIVHASPKTAWASPSTSATDTELAETYGALGQPIVVYAHLHHAFVRTLEHLTVVNTGSVGRSLDGDPRAAYAIIEERSATIRRVEYDVDREIAVVTRSRLPHARWTAEMLRTARASLP